MPSLPAEHVVASSPVKQHRTEKDDRQAKRALNTGSTRWFRIRQKVLVRDCYTCQMCGILCSEKGQAQVDHKDGDSSHNDLDRLWVLCISCHSKKTQEDRKRLK